MAPIHALIRNHVLAAERLHGDDTTVPLLAKGGTQTARLWTYVRDDRPFGGAAPPAALFHFSRDREMAQVFLLPTRNPSFLPRGATAFEGSIPAGVRPIAPHLEALLFDRGAMRQRLPRRAAIDIGVMVIGKIGLYEMAF